MGFKVCLDVPSLRQCPSPSLAKCNIVSMVTNRFMDRMGSEPILFVNVNLMETEMDTGTETVCVNGPL